MASAGNEIDIAVIMEAFRKTLREARETKGGRDDFADDIKVAKSTVQTAEMGPDVPKLDTVIKMILGAGMSLSDFFARMEGRQISPLRTDAEKSKTAPSLPTEEAGHVDVAIPYPPNIVGLSLALTGCVQALILRLDHLMEFMAERERADEAARAAQPKKRRTRAARPGGSATAVPRRTEQIR